MTWLFLTAAALCCLVALTAAVFPSHSPQMTTSRRRKTYALSLVCTVTGIVLLLFIVDW